MAGVGKATFVLVSAAINIPKREIDVAPEMMEASQIHRELVLLGDLLRLIEQMQGFTQAFADPKTFSQADLRSAASDVIRRCFYGFAVREHRRSSISEVPFELSLQANERMTAISHPRAARRNAASKLDRCAAVARR